MRGGGKALNPVEPMAPWQTAWPLVPILAMIAWGAWGAWGSRKERQLDPLLVGVLLLVVLLLQPYVFISVFMSLLKTIENGAEND